MHSWDLISLNARCNLRCQGIYFPLKSLSSSPFSYQDMEIIAIRIICIRKWIRLQLFSHNHRLWNKLLIVYQCAGTFKVARLEMSVTWRIIKTRFYYSEVFRSEVKKRSGCPEKRTTLIFTTQTKWLLEYCGFLNGGSIYTAVCAFLHVSYTLIKCKRGGGGAFPLTVH